MIGTELGIDVRVKTQDVITSQLPEYILSEAPLTDEFLKQFYISQEFQSGPVDIATNLDQYLDLVTLTSEDIYASFELTEPVSVDDTVIHVNTTKSFPNQWGLLKIDDEIITYTGLTTNTFTGAVRGFSGITSYRGGGDNNPNELIFETTSAASHEAGDKVDNLSTQFLKRFYSKLKYTFAPGFENLEFNSQIGVGQWIRNARSFYQSKGSEESFKILFKVLYGEEPLVIDLEQFLIKPSEAEFSRRDYAVAIPVSGNPVTLRGKTVYQSDAEDVFGAISEIESFTRDNELYYRIYFFVSNDEIANERKLFTIPGRTRSQRQWNPGDTTLTVDTTLGFRNNNEFITADGTKFSYVERTVNQFLGVTCSDSEKVIGINEDIIDDITISGINDDGEEVALRITGVISDLDFGGKVPFTSVGEKISVDTLGENILSAEVTRVEPTQKQIIANSFIYNTSVRMEVDEINGSDFSIDTAYLDKAFIAPGDSVDVLQRGSQIVYVADRKVTSVDYLNSIITISDSFGIPLDQAVDIRRNQNYAKSSTTNIEYGQNAVLSNVLNLYDASEYDGNFYVATNSLPSYDMEVKIVESIITGITTSNLEGFNSFTGEYSIIVFDEDTDFRNGDLVSYKVIDQDRIDTPPICPEGEYFVEVLSDPRKIKLYVSPSFIGSENTVGLIYADGPAAHVFTLQSQKDRTINTKNVFKKIPYTGTKQNITIDRTPTDTPLDLPVAVLTNGVEVLSFKSPDKVFLGPIEEVIPVSSGEGYSVVDPQTVTLSEPNIQVTDSTGIPTATIARVTPVISGKLERIFIDPQDFSIAEVFSITVVGGNSRGATAKPQVEKKSRVIPFDTRLDVYGGGIDPNADTIVFLVDHKLAKGDAIIYNNNVQGSVSVGDFDGSNSESGRTLANGGIYYAEPLNNITIKLYESREDSIIGVNTVGFTSDTSGKGIQDFSTIPSNQLIGAIITDDGGDFVYRKMEFQPDNIYVSYDELRYDNHGFQTGELVEYGTAGISVGGLSTSNSYYVTALDENTIKLSDAGIGGTSTFDFNREDFVDFSSTGVGTHFIKYPDISVEVVVSFASTITGEVVATPVIRGGIVQTYVNDGGYYGSDIINFQKNPEVTISRGNGARLKPVVINGVVTAVQILSKGIDYPSSPDLRVIDKSENPGQGCILRAVVEDGSIQEVIIIGGGKDYDPLLTDIDVVDPSRDAILIPRIRSLTVNTYARFGFEGLSNNDYSIVAYDRKIREDVYNDLGATHSPIIGWAQDGNPIYGGFGLDDPENASSEFRAMRTSYALAPDAIFGRPPQSLYPAGFFVEDYKYTGLGDLDEHNGRYGKTPEYPNGVYAYFAGISTDTQSLARDPQFPYFIGPQYRDGAGLVDPTVSQDFDINNEKIFRNTFPYAVGNPFIGSEFLDQSYLQDVQETIIQSINAGTIDGLTIVGAGASYSVGDIVNFDDTDDYISVVIDQVEGAEVVQIESLVQSYGKEVTKLVRVDNETVRVYVYPYHTYIDGDKVVLSGLSTFTQQVAGTHEIGFDRGQMSLFAPVPRTAFESVDDVFVNSISDKVSVGSSICLGIGTMAEPVEVLNIFPINKALRVRRPVGFGYTHNIGDIVTISPQWFDIKKNTDAFASEVDVQYYFNPKQTVAVGVETGASVGLVFSIGNIDKNISVQTQRIYAPSHSFRTGEEVTFEKDDFDSAFVVTDGSAVYGLPSVGNTGTAYVVSLSKNYIGLRTDPRGADLFFSSNGSDSPLYSLKTNRFAENTLVDRIQAKVTTETDHRLENGDLVITSISSRGNAGVGSNPSVIVEFDEPSQTLIIDPSKVEPSGINTITNLITLPNHGYVDGDLLLYQNEYGGGIAGLTTHHKYYVMIFDRDKFSLAETFVDIRPGSRLPVDLESAGVGTHRFSKVNPTLIITNDNDVEFDVSSPTLFGMELDFYYDQTLTEVFDNNGTDDPFVVSGVSTEGYPDGRKFIANSTNNPDVFYYGLSKGGYICTADVNVSRYNSIRYEPSLYSIESEVTVVDNKVFTYTLNTIPENDIYETPESDVSYLTSSETALGGVGRMNIIFSGNNFETLPEFEGIQTEYGINASIRAESDDIGTLASYRIQNAGWDYSADRTLRPAGIIQPTIRFGNSDFVTNINILDGGNGYTSAPQTVLVDSVTRETVDNGAISLEVQSSTISEVNIEVAPSGLSKNIHELWTINNSNGIPILLINTIDQPTGVVTFTIQTPIEGYAEPPFEVGDKVFVENILIDPGAPDSKLNSADYGYQFLEVTQVGFANPITVGVRYPEDAINNLGYGATFQQAFSGMVNENIYPKFEVLEDTAVFIEGERLSIFDSQGNLDETDLIVEESNTSFFKVTGNYDILVGDVLKGNNSGVIITVTAIDTEGCRFEVDSISRINTGWNDQTGFLNEETQALPDNDYYQNLSYSIKSTIDFETLISPVNRLVHPSGLKNFSETKIESNADIGIGSSESSETTITIDLIGLTDISETPLRVDRINVFDLGWDDNVNNNRSNAIRLQSRTPNKRLTDYIEVRTNRVLMMDDISDRFIDADNARNKNPYVEFNIITSDYTRGVLQARNPFTDQVQFTEIILITYNNSAFTLGKASISDNEIGYGEFEGIALPSSEYQFRFTPFNLETFDLDFKLFTNKFTFTNEAPAEIGFITLAGNTFTGPANSSTQVYGASSSNNKAVTVTATVKSIYGRIMYYEVYAFVIGTDVFFAPYDFNNDFFTDYSGEFDGEFSATLQGGRLAVYFTNNTDDLVAIDTKTVEYKQASTGTAPYRFKRSNIPDGEERSLILDSTSTSGVTTTTNEIFRYSRELFQSVRSVVYISGGDVGAFHQVMAINSGDSTFVEAYPFITQGDHIDSTSGIGTFGTRFDGTDMVLDFYPDPSLGSQSLEYVSYNEVFYRDLDEINYTISLPLVYSETEENYYLERFIAPLGERNDLVRFPLLFEGTPIYQKRFDPSLVISDAGPSGLNIFNINDHFFSTAEELIYRPGTSLENGLVSPIQIVPTVDYRGITTSTLPDRVYAVKRDLNKFQLAATPAQADVFDVIEITGFGDGIAHTLDMTKKLEKTMITIDGVIQAPISNALKTYNLDQPLAFDDEYAVLTGIGTIRVGDLLLVNQEYVKIDNIGFGTDSGGPISNTGDIPLIEITRGVVGSAATDHSSGTPLDLYRGSFNIVDSDVVFTEAPSGKGEININESNLVEVNSSFQGRTFLQKEYDQIALLDDISDRFNGQDFEFNMTSAGSTISEIENGSGVLIINDIYQTPTTDNNAGNNYFYSYGEQTGINTLTFTGITSTNGQRVESLFDINQNQIPRGGVIVSLGSTPGLGYAPLYGAKLQPVITGGVITDIITTNRIGVTTDVIWADYNHINGDLVVTGVGSALTAEFNISDADYRNTSGILIVTSTTSLISAGLNPGDIVYLRNLNFSCTSGGAPATLTYPDEDPVYAIDKIVDEFRFSVNAGLSTIPHTYVSGGTWQKYSPFQFGREALNPKLVYLDGLEFSCPPNSETGYGQNYAVSDFVYDTTTGIGTVTTATPHDVLPNSFPITLQGLEFDCGGTSLPTLDVLNAIYDATVGIATITFDGLHETTVGGRVQLSGLEFECPGESLPTLSVTNAPYDALSGIVTITFGSSHNSNIGDRIRLSGLEYSCDTSYQTQYDVTNAIYDNASGIVTVFTNNTHGLLPTDRTKLEGLVFTCNPDDYLTNVGVSSALYDSIAGVVTVTTSAPHTLTTGELAGLENLLFSCGFGTSVYPRPGVEGVVFQSTVVDATNVSFNVGVSTLGHSYVSGGEVRVGFTTTVYPSGVFGDTFEVIGAAGTSFSVNVGINTIPTTYVSGGTVNVGFTTTVYPDGTFGYEFLVADVIDTTTLSVNVGTSTIPHTYVTGGIGTVGFTTNIFPDGTNGYEFNVTSVVNTTTLALNVGTGAGIDHIYVSGGIGTVGITTTIFPDGTRPQGSEFNVLGVPSVNEITLDVGTGAGIPHTYVSGGRVVVGFTTTIFPDSFESAPFVTRDDDAHFRLNVGVVSFSHDYVSGGTFGQYIENNPGSGYIERVSIAVTDLTNNGSGAEIVGIPTDGGELSFSIIDGGSGYTDGLTDIFAPDPVYEGMSVIGVFRRNIGFSTVTGKNLFVTLEVTAAPTSGAGRSEYFEVSGYQITNQGYAFEEGDVLEVVGIPTAKGLAEPLEPFQLTVLDIFTDNFAAWNFGETDYIDSIRSLQDGQRTQFPLQYKGEDLSFEKNPSNEDSAAIDIAAILLIYVNTVLQVPGESYLFDGGNTFQFTTAPFPQDDIDIYFYRGKRDLDSVIVTEVDESIRPGDKLQIVKNNKYNDNKFNDLTKTQDLRTVTEIASSDSVRTNIYFGNNDLETLRERQVAWEKQKRDIFIYGEVAPKTRDSIESIIKPTAAIIRSATNTTNEMFLSNGEFFVYEEDVPGSSVVLTNIEATILRPTEYKYNPPVKFQPADVRANVNSAGKVSSLTILDAGAGYSSDTDITIGVSTTGDRAVVGSTILNPIDGSIISLIVSDGGDGYDPSNPPFVLIEEPQVDVEVIERVPTIQGFAGIVTGIQATTGSSGATKGIRVFYQVDPTVVASELNAGYSLVLTNTVVGNGVETIGNNAATVVGVGTQFLDGVYEVRFNTNLGFNGYWEANVSNGTDISGIDISGENLGQFSWGRVANLARDIDFSLTYRVDGATYTSDMENYPTFKRTSEGLRNEGGISKKVL